MFDRSIPGVNPSLIVEHEEVKTLYEKYLDPANVRCIIEIGSLDCVGGLVFSDDFPNAEIYCFEPSPPQREICENNAQYSDRVHFFPYAVSDFSGETNFYPASKNRGLSSMHPIDGYCPLGSTAVDPVRVDCVILDHFAYEHDISKVDIFDIDVQGEELPIIKHNSIIWTADLIKIEVNIGPYYRDQVRSKETVIEILEGKGFTKIGEDEGNKYDQDLFFVKNELIKD